MRKSISDRGLPAFAFELRRAGGGWSRRDFTQKETRLCEGSGAAGEGSEERISILAKHSLCLLCYLLLRRKEIRRARRSRPTDLSYPCDPWSGKLFKSG